MECCFHRAWLRGATNLHQISSNTRKLSFSAWDRKLPWWDLWLTGTFCSALLRTRCSWYIGMFGTLWEHFRDVQAAEGIEASRLVLFCVRSRSTFDPIMHRTDNEISQQAVLSDLTHSQPRPIKPRKSDHYFIIYRHVDNWMYCNNSIARRQARRVHLEWCLVSRLHAFTRTQEKPSKTLATFLLDG